MHLLAEVSAGILSTITVGLPGTHGAGSTGTHGPGVSTPIAAAVCAAVTGLARLLHITNGNTLAIGMLSVMLAAGCPPMVVRCNGITTRVAGAMPNVHIVVAPLTTGWPMAEQYAASVRAVRVTVLDCPSGHGEREIIVCQAE